MTGLLLGLILFSTYYVAWMIVLAVVVFVVVFTPLQAAACGLRKCVDVVRSRVAAIVGFGAGATVGVIPFLIVYLPVLRENGGRTYEQVMTYAPTPRDLLNLGDSNYLWGSLVRSHVPLDHLGNTETSLAATPVLVILAAGAVLVAFRMWRSTEFAAWSRLCVAAGITALVLSILPIKFGFGSLWRLPWMAMPGAEGIRAIGRVDMVVAPLACLTVALGLAIARCICRQSPRRTPALSLGVGVLVALGAVEQLNVGEFARIDRSIENERLSEAPAPPATCRSFFIIDREMLSFVANIDAMVLAEHFGIPTVNGYSGQYPAGYILLDMSDPQYFANVRTWVERNDVEDGLCSYDTVARVWAPAPPPS